jgi:hypothetical protein
MAMTQLPGHLKKAGKIALDLKIEKKTDLAHG